MKVSLEFFLVICFIIDINNLIDEEDDVNKHKWQRPDRDMYANSTVDLLVCSECGRSKIGSKPVKFACSWGAAAGGGTTPIPGGFDRLGVVKELRNGLVELELLPNFTLRVDGDRYRRIRKSLQHLISRLEGQGAEKPAASEPKGQC